MASIQFCKDCNNLLYPKEDKPRHVLLYQCRNCQYYEPTTNPLVYRHDLQNVTRETAGVTQDLETDPTLPRSEMQCPHCSHTDAVYFQGQAKRIETKMTLFYYCTHCHKVFQDPKVTNR